MGSWWTIRRAVFLLLGWLAFGMASFSASLVPADQRIPHFIGGSIWPVLFFAIALWPRRKPKPRAADGKRERAEPGAAADGGGR